MNELHSAIQKVYEALFAKPQKSYTQRNLSSMVSVSDDALDRALDVMFDFGMIEIIDKRDRVSDHYSIPKWRYLDQILIERDRGDFHVKGIGHE